MKSNKYGMHRQFLYFSDPATEDRYRDYTIKRTLNFTKATWFIVIILAAVFSILDKHFFDHNASLVYTMRFGIITLSALMIWRTGDPKFRRMTDWHAFIFVFFLGHFCNVLTFLDVTKGFSLWFTSLFFVCPGVLITAGIGFRYSFIALLTTPIVFNLLYFTGRSFQVNEFLFYNIFLIGMLVIYIFVAFLVENIFRKNYVTMEKLKDSMEEIHHLSGLLPICSKCKKIRDDSGYWQQVETYIQDRSEATFSHGLCPGCMDDIYGQKEWYKKMKAEKSH